MYQTGINMKSSTKRISIFANLPRRLYRFLRDLLFGSRRFQGSEKYWERRYSSGRNSGSGSYDMLAEFKAEILNSFVATHDISTVIEFGCGDGNQLSLANYPEYMGFDVSQTAIDICKEKYSTDNSKNFKLMKEFDGDTADLVLSLDVIYHLVEDEIFDHYMQSLFRAGIHYVIIYSSNFNDDENYQGRHVRHRKFTKWIHDKEPQWMLMEHIPNRYPYQGDDRTGSFADFYIYGKR